MEPTAIRAIAHAALEEAGWPQLGDHLEGPLKKLSRCYDRLEASCEAGEAERARSELRALLAMLFAPVGAVEHPGRSAALPATAFSAETELERLAPSPRVLAPPLAKLVADPATALASLNAPLAETRALALRALDPTDTPEFVRRIAELVASDPEPFVRSEALAVARSWSEKLKGKLGKALVRFSLATEAPTRSSAILAMTMLGAELTEKAMARALADADPTVRAAAARSVTPKPSEGTEAGLLALLRERDPQVQDAALAGIRQAKLTRESRDPAALIDALRGIVRGKDAERVALAVYLLWNFGPAASHAALDVVRALPLTADPDQAAKTLAAFEVTPPEAVPLLESFVGGPRSDVANAAARILADHYGQAPIVPLAVELDRIRNELTSNERRHRLSGVGAALRLGPKAAEIAAELVSAGLAAAATANDGPLFAFELTRIREALLATGYPAADLPRAPSDLPGYHGHSPRERARFDAYVVAEVGGHHEPGSLRLPSLGVWEAGSGKPLFVVEGAEVLEPRTDVAEVVLVRLETAAAPGEEEATTATQRRYFERFSLPEGRRVASTALDVHGSPAGITLAARDSVVLAKIRFEDVAGIKPMWLLLGESGSDTVVPSPAKQKRAKKHRHTRAKPGA